jgi:hypothetical protein
MGVPIGLYENFEKLHKVKAKRAACSIYRRCWLYCLVASINNQIRGFVRESGEWEVL